MEDGVLVGKVLYVDDFGNVISNISSDHLEESGITKFRSIGVVLGGKKMCLPLCSTYDSVSVGSSLLLLGGTGFLEVAVNQGSASKTYSIKIGDYFSIFVPS
jgi:S-adenosylmethionine hydrolase